MLISIITATYNSGKTVRDTLESILNQTFQDFEVIIKDGGSKDNTLDICNEYLEKFNGKLRIISQPDKGIYDAMNQGINAASGQIVGILNSDDFYTSNDVLATVVSTFQNNVSIEAMYADVQYVEWNDTTKKVRYYSSRVFRRPLMRLGWLPAHPTFYCKKSVYEKFKLDGNKIDGFKGNPNCAYFNTTYKIAADFENLLRMIFVGRIQTKYVHKNLVTMRIGGASSSGIAVHKQINREHLRALRENGVYSNILLLSLRYVYKIGELILGKLGIK